MIVQANTLPTDELAATIASYEHQLFTSGAWSENAVREELTGPNRYYIVDIDSDSDADADADGETQPTVRGYAGYWYDGYDAEIMTIAVAPTYQHHGIGGALLDNLIQQARTQGAERILLEVRVDNTAAIHLYETRGFTHMGLRKRYYQPEGIDAYTMSLTLRKHIMGFTSTQE